MGFIRNFFALRRLRGKKGSLRRLFFERAEHFTRTTIGILERMPGVIEAIKEMIEEKETFKSGGILEWTEVSIVGMTEDDSLIVLVGNVTFPAGAIVELATGEKVAVTPDTAQYFPPRMIRIGVPVKLAESSKEEIKAYIKKTEAEQENDQKEFVKELEQALGVEEPVKVTRKQDTIDTGEDFDLTQLTDEQRKQLELSQKMGRG